MIQINNQNDLDNAALPTEIKRLLSKYLNGILNSYGCHNLDNLGSIYFLESHEEAQSPLDFAFDRRLKDLPFEYCELISLSDSHGEETLFHGCLICNNDFAIDLFGRSSILDDETKNILLSH